MAEENSVAEDALEESAKATKKGLGLLGKGLKFLFRNVLLMPVTHTKVFCALAAAAIAAPGIVELATAFNAGASASGALAMGAQTYQPAIEGGAEVLHNMIA